MSLCRHYVELRRSILVGTPELEKGESKRSSQVLESLGDMNHPVAGPAYLSSEKERGQDAQMSAFLREERSHGHGHSPTAASAPRPPPACKQSASRPLTASHHAQASCPPHSILLPNLPTLQLTLSHVPTFATPPRRSFTPSSFQARARNHPPTLYPNDITVSIEDLGRDDPEVFDAAKDYVYQAMERDAFPGFLRMKALGNLTPVSCMFRLLLGLLGMFAGFWAALSSSSSTSLSTLAAGRSRHLRLVFTALPRISIALIR